MVYLRTFTIKVNIPVPWILWKNYLEGWNRISHLFFSASFVQTFKVGFRESHEVVLLMGVPILLTQLRYLAGIDHISPSCTGLSWKTIDSKVSLGGWDILVPRKVYETLGAGLQYVLLLSLFCGNDPN